ncbi:hypothetical protein CC78DRAFT_582948 [Lojkania enalia]|uniref:Nephrocystin 3-like N-terminal domain-containing protein n=1 Tax=Lojkania enalia TaxID=147567 RepID=A0A9P4K576_9PLEO|nr:hypothetical protein CC78DRAFT_582948 [Didymosphaeria enalia]
MTEVLGATASLISLVETAVLVLKYLNDVNSARDDIVRLKQEMVTLISVLSTLKMLADSGHPWSANVHSLGVKDGPLQQFKQTLERLSKLLAPLRGFRERIIFPLKKGEIVTLLDELERFEGIFNLAIELDNSKSNSSSSSKVTQATLSYVRDMAQRFSGLVISKIEAENKEITHWMSSLSFTGRQIDMFQRRQEGTCQWVLESPEVKRWLSHEATTFWCWGAPGAGKTIFASVLINFLEKMAQGEGAALIYIYCMYNERAEQTASNLVSSLLQQLLLQRSNIPDQILSKYHYHTMRNSRPSLEDWSTLLASELRLWPRTFLVINALDECEENTRFEFLACIKKLPNTSLLVTSRPNIMIQN